MAPKATHVHGQVGKGARCCTAPSSKAGNNLTFLSRGLSGGISVNGVPCGHGKGGH